MASRNISISLEDDKIEKYKKIADDKKWAFSTLVEVALAEYVKRTVLSKVMSPQ